MRSLLSRTAAASRLSGGTCWRATATGTWPAGSAEWEASARAPGSCPDRTRRRRPALLAGQGGRSAGAGAVHGPGPGTQPRAARRPGPAVDAGRHGHLPRLAARNGTDDTTRDYYVRQLWDWKLGAEVELMSPARLTVFGTLCGWTLARAHARLEIASRSGRISARARRSTAPSGFRGNLRGPERARPRR